ncbi:hypothetical protein NEOLEDRAFT_1243759 [Neolentinus lepideus HHB14362 ss-1]|uniref:Diphthamide biosynthesis protein 4 n=1 Tax=Neolentinus lepideus HHB14362 ss-1 TaxID=1314782 RepID=A0A165QNG5_9AGAM|nr:hypothetical protein NEOLEDRAFT_1243759 [Neolentinus lepideus HHB14362 ss-1]
MSVPAGVRTRVVIIAQTRGGVAIPTVAVLNIRGDTRVTAILALSEFDYYALLGLIDTPSSSFTPAAFTSAYHRALLTHHPDKQHTPSPGLDTRGNDVITQIQAAYKILSSSTIRATYDRQLAHSRTLSGPRPAQIVSLEDFTEDGEGERRWTYGCRCGGTYVITEREMEDDRHLIGCRSCSEIVWVGYEVAEDEEWEGKNH